MAFAFLNRYRTVAAPGYSRWLIPPAALCVHLCIGQAYAFSVFNLPVSTLIRWFPDRPGMATGMAIMGFGGGAFIASPLSVWLMGQFSTPTHIGVAETFVVMGLIYLCFMMVGATIVRLPPPGWAPAGFVMPRESRLVTTRNVFVYEALKTPQFWLIWRVLCLNVTAGIGVLGQRSEERRVGKGVWEW